MTTREVTLDLSGASEPGLKPPYHMYFSDTSTIEYLDRWVKKNISICKQSDTFVPD